MPASRNTTPSSMDDGRIVSENTEEFATLLIDRLQRVKVDVCNFEELQIDCALCDKHTEGPKTSSQTDATLKHVDELLSQMILLNKK